MRIAIAYDVIYPFTKGGGEKIVYEVMRRLGARHEIHLFSLKLWPGENTIEMAPNVWAHGVCGVPAHLNAASDEFHVLSQVLRYSVCLPRAILKHGPFDVVDCYSIPYFPLLSAKTACVLSRSPLISTWLEVWPRAVWRKKFGYFGGTVGYAIQKMFAHLPKRLIAISEHTRQGLLGLEIPEQRVCVITPGIDWNEIQEAPLEQRACDIIFVGRLIKDKGVDKLLEALPAVRRHKPDIRCRIVGDGPERRALESLGDSLGVRENVEFTGSVDSVYPFLKSAKMLVHPSRREGFGITLIEAAACGIPVITVAEPGNASRELVERGNIGIVCKLEAGPLAESILSLMDSADVRDEYGARARTWSQQYDWNNIAHAFESAYCQFLNEKKNMQAA